MREIQFRSSFKGLEAFSLFRVIYSIWELFEQHNKDQFSRCFIALPIIKSIVQTLARWLLLQAHFWLWEHFYLIYSPPPT